MAQITLNSTGVASNGTLALQSNGTTTAVTIDASQNVGVGTSSPYSQLDVSSSIVSPTTGEATGVGSIRITNGASALSSAGGLEFKNAGDSNGYGAKIQTLNSGGPQLVFANRVGSATWTERMRIDSSGNVGIGTSSPAAKLSVNQTGIAVNIGDISSAPSSNVNVFVGAATSALSGTNGDLVLCPRTSTTASILFYTGNGTAAERMRINDTGGLILAGSTAQKASGTTWSNPSDQRLKDNIRDYAKGTTELMQVRVRQWEYNGKGGTTEGMKGLGVIADEVMTVLPNTVEDYDAKLNADDEETTAIKKFDATEITWLLVKTVQEQQAIITQLQADVAALKGTA
jgi:hypothetical protein